MGIIKKGANLMWGLGMNGLPKEMSDYLNRMLLEEQEDREAFAAELEGFSEADLMAFVPDVYQKSIYKIDYGKLKEKGIMLISFDIDDMWPTEPTSRYA